MRHEKRVIDLSTQLEKAGWEGSLLPKKRFLDQVFPNLPKFWRQTKNRATTQLEQLSFQDFDRFNARELTLTGDIIQQFRSSGVFKGGIFKTKKLLDYNKSLADKLEDPRYASMKNKDLPDFKKVQEIKKTLNYIWDLSQRAGIDLGPREQYYFPRMIKPEFLGIFNKDIANFSKQNSELAFNKNLPNNKDFQKLINVFIETNQFDPATVKALQKIAKVDPNVKQKTRAEIAE